MGNFQQGMATRSDMGLPFRRQEPRSMDDIDELFQRQQQLRLYLGLERADYIEKHVELFADGEKFRIYHDQARWNTFWFMIASYVGGIGAANMFAPQINVRGLMKAYPPVFIAGGIGYGMVSYHIFHKLAGFDVRNWREFSYAKMCRMLRNVQIKQ